VSPPPRLTREALVHLARYPFLGNVRELENLLHRAVALTGTEEIDVHDLGLPDEVFTDSAAQELDLITENTQQDRVDAGLVRPVVLPQPALPSDLGEYLDQVERDILERALERHRFNRTAAGASLGLSLRQMRYRMARLGVHVGGDFGNERD
jgi:two-component system, NtrC family, response regulator PilR